MDYLELVEKFNSCELEHKYWDHKSHLIVALFYILNFKENAFENIKKGIIKFNESNGTLNSDTSGYHETLTIFWLKKAEEFIVKNSISDFSNENVEKLLNSEYCDKNFPLKYYSRDLIQQVGTRKSWVEPDLQDLL